MKTRSIMPYILSGFGMLAYTIFKSYKMGREDEKHIAELTEELSNYKHELDKSIKTLEEALSILNHIDPPHRMVLKDIEVLQQLYERVYDCRVKCNTSISAYERLKSKR